jgi:uncharacterized membrane protein
MSVVSCRFFGAGEAGVDVLALLASQQLYIVAGERRRLVYLPAAPIPMSGGLVFVADAAITPVPEMKVDDLLKIYVSLGALAPEVFPRASGSQPAISLAPQQGARLAAPSPLAKAESV